MELWDIYDAERNKTGRTHKRGEPLAAGDNHLVVHICVFNAKGQMLIQQRQPFKQGWPDKWDISVGGSAVAGETSANAAGRELREELGITENFSGKSPVLSHRFSCGFDDIWFVDRDIPLSDLHLQPEEVQNARYVGEDEILTAIDNGSFIPYFPDFIRLLFHLHTQCDCIKPPHDGSAILR